MKLTDISKLILSTDISNVNAFRFWMVILVILVYLSIRYRFSDAIISQISFLQSELKTQRESYLLEYLQVKINQINRTGQFLPIFDASLEKSVNRNMDQCESKNLSFQLHIQNPWSEASPVDLDGHNPIWEGAVFISEEYFREGASRNFATSHGPRHNFSVPLSGRVSVTIRSLIRILSYSKSAVDFFVPIVLAYIAILLIISRLTATY